MPVDEVGRDVGVISDRVATWRTAPLGPVAVDERMHVLATLSEHPSMSRRLHDEPGVDQVKLVDVGDDQTSLLHAERPGVKVEVDPDVPADHALPAFGLLWRATLPLVTLKYSPQAAQGL